MLKRFLENLTLTSRTERKTIEQVVLPILLNKASDAVEFLSKLSGSTFNGGLYRVHSLAEIEKWTKIVESAFPSFKGRIACLTYDWLGRQFALDSNRVSESEPLLLMFDVGAGEVIDITMSFHDFHNLIVDYPDEVLASAFFTEWKSTIGHELQPTQCVGYKIPLFLNGQEELSNLEVTSMKLYWELFGQILEQVRNLPPGTRLSKLKIG